MRPLRRTRRSAGARSAAKLLVAVFLLLTAGTRAVPLGTEGPRPLVVEARPLTHFQPAQPGRVRFGALTFLGGVQLVSRDRSFGGWSGLWRSPDGGRIVAVSDHGHWLSAALVISAESRIAGLADARIEPMIGPDGRPVAATRLWDVESLASNGRVAYVGIERTHSVLRYDFGAAGITGEAALATRGQPIPVPEAVRSLPGNSGLEALALAPRTGPLAGSLVAIAERSDGADDPTRGWILNGRSRGTFTVARYGRFDITDAVFLPDGDLLVLERFYQPFKGVAMRLRRIAGSGIRPGAVLDGPVLFEADMGYQIDNMEGLAITRDSDGRLRLLIISDDNFSAAQRTLLLEFELNDD